jgi:protein-arginine kinase
MTSLSTKHLSADIRSRLEGITAKCGFTIDDIVRSGIENPDSNIGAYAGDEDSYRKFSPLLDRIIEDYHGHRPEDIHTSNLNAGELPTLANPDPAGNSIVSTRIRVARNIQDYPFPPALSSTHRAEIEAMIVPVLKQLPGELSGTYFPLAEMNEQTRITLTEQHFLFKKGDRFLESGGINREWPKNRGIFLSEDNRFLVWVNEEDELRIISMQQGGNIRQVFERLVKGISAIEACVAFASNKHLGYLTSCPTNLGTAMRASVHIKLPQLIEHGLLPELCEKLDLSFRGIHGEHSETAGGVCDISNKKRLGISELDCINRLHQGISQLLAMERKLS